MSNKYLEKIAELSDGQKTGLQTATLFGVGTAGTYGAAKLANTDVVKNSFKRMTPHGKMALIGGGLGLLGDYAAVKVNQHIEKQSGILSTAFDLIKSDARKLPGQIKTLGTDIRTAPRTMTGIKSIGPSVKPVLQNKALQAGAATAGAIGLATRGMSGDDQQRQN